MTKNQSLINRLKREIVQATMRVSEGHISITISILEIIWVLYDRILRINPSLHKDHDGTMLCQEIKEGN